LDTGSGKTLIQTSVTRQLNLPVQPLSNGHFSMMFAAEGSPIHVNGFVDISFNINGLIIPHTVYVVE
jgi:hypothetical protein